jgi:glycosyltransferase involved in cell wall biosynthesis
MRVIHFVTGGFSGSTNVAKEIIENTNQTSDIESLLVLRKKKSTTEEKLKSFYNLGIDTRLVSSKLHVLTIHQLYKICKEYKPDILVVHGFSEHIWGRYAGLLAKVPHLVHVEHNSRERYTWLRLKQAKWLSRYTAKIIGCSEGVKQNLLRLGFPAEKVVSIPNGINLTRFDQSTQVPFCKRKAEIIMAARFARQKDQTSLIKAIALLKNKDIEVKVNFAGLGKSSHIVTAQKLVKRLGLEQQISFLGHCTNLPELLTQHQIFVLSTHYEGMPLALIEAMASGCAIVASEVVGVKEMFVHGEDGYLVEPQSPRALAEAIEKLLADKDYTEKMAISGQKKARSQFSVERMAGEYKLLFRSLYKT